METTGERAGHFTAERYLELGECGILTPDDRVELLDGLLVAMAPPSPRHDTAVERVQYALLRGLGLGVSTRVQCSFAAGGDSVPQPDVMVLPGKPDDLDHHLPTRAHLIVEVALSSLPQDRLTKSAFYARAAVPCYWIVNLRDECVEVFRDVDRWKAEYRCVTRAVGEDPLVIDDFPGVTFRAADLLPRRARH
jgi:Uma2 family endonuclease